MSKDQLKNQAYLIRFGKSKPLLPAEYRHKLSQIDQAYHGTRRGDIGPCVAKFLTFGNILELGVGDGHREMHRLHDVLQFFETSLKNRIVKN